MKKKTNKIHFFILIFFLFSAFFLSSVFAAGDMPRLVDNANLLSDDEKTELLNKLDEISNRQQVDIVIVTVDSLEGASPSQYADDFYDTHGYGFGTQKDGVLFLISMEERDWYITTTGYGITALTDAGLNYVSEQFLDDLSTGVYAAAFTTFAELCDDFITQARNGNPYDINSLPKKPFWLAGSLGISFGIAFLISLFITGMMKRKLKSVHYQAAADHYIQKGSMRMTQKSDLFLYHHINRRKKIKNNTTAHTGGSRTHTSSSGRTHGGRGGKF